MEKKNKVTPEKKEEKKEVAKKVEKKEPVITAEMNIFEIVQGHPDTIELFLERGIHCFGCMAAHFETLEEGLMAHGMTNEEIDDFVDKLNEKIKEKDKK
jgi:hybrid cluster-associated redox disulfide protein